jgi:hypothetical protein
MLSREQTGISTEEADMLSSSNKKIKVNSGNQEADVGNGSSPSIGTQAGSGGISYKDSLMGASYIDHESNKDHTKHDYISDDDEEEDGDEECPLIKLSAEEKKPLKEPWRQPLLKSWGGRLAIHI